MAGSGTNLVRHLTEAAVIVSSILFALALDAWWDGVQEERSREAVFVALSTDFEAARAYLAGAIPASESRLSGTEALLRAAGERVPLPRDSIIFLGESVVAGEAAPPALPRYDAAVAGGQLNLIDDDSLIVALSRFDQLRANYERWQDQRRAAFVNGALQDLRRELGSLSVLSPVGGRLPAPPAFRDVDLNEVIQRPSSYAAIEPIHVARFNYVVLLREMDARAVEILSILAARQRH